MATVWKNGILEVRAETTPLNCLKLFQTHYSNWGEAHKSNIDICH
jgi:hypothetical protein